MNQANGWLANVTGRCQSIGSALAEDAQTTITAFATTKQVSTPGPRSEDVFAHLHQRSNIHLVVKRKVLSVHDLDRSYGVLRPILPNLDSCLRDGADRFKWYDIWHSTERIFANFAIELGVGGYFQARDVFQ